MAKRKRVDAERTEDGHRSGSRMIRLPPDHAAMLDRIAEAEERTRTTVVVRALRAYYSANGYEFPPQT